MLTEYQIETDLSEKQIEADVASYFGRLSPLFGKTLRLLDIDEQLTGADKRYYQRGVAYFFQFKKPIGLKSTTSLKLPAKPRKNESKLMAIRRFRDANNLDQTPYSVCFPLHGDALTPVNQLQHNILFAHEKPPHSRAMYVCPTVLNSHAYVNAMHVPVWRRPFVHPFERLATRNVLAGTAKFALETAPFLRGHATVVPHVPVASHDHYYSFSIHATDYAFHSPELIGSYRPSRLSDFLGAELRRIALEPDSVASLDVLARRIYESSTEAMTLQVAPPDRQDPIEWIQRYGIELRARFGIRQMLLLVNPDEMNSPWEG